MLTVNLSIYRQHAVGFRSSVIELRSVTVGTIFDSRVGGRAATVTTVLRVITGAVFVLFSLPKFLLHDFERAEFVLYGLPDSSALVYLVGLAELCGGAALVLGLLTRPAAAVLAITMVGAVLTGGIQVGGPIHLGLAPALLVASTYLAWAGYGSRGWDRRLAREVAATAR
jgi:putative oxidoreductase